MGEREYGIDPGVTRALAKEVAGIRAEGVDVAVVVGGGNFYRGLAAAAESGMDRATADYARDARDAPQCARAAGRARAGGRRHARHVRARGLGGRGAVHPAPRHAAPREGPRRDLRRRHRQPVLHDRHGGSAPRSRDRRRRDPHGEARRPGRLRRRSATGLRRRVPAADHAPRGDRARAEGHGHDGSFALHGQPAYDPRLRARRGQRRPRRQRARRSARSSRRLEARRAKGWRLQKS